MAGKVWKDGMRRGIAYVEGREAAQQIMALTGRTPPGVSRRPARGDEAPLEGAMAVYLDRRGRPFAWQIPFDIGHWDRVAAVVDAP